MNVLLAITLFGLICIIANCENQHMICKTLHDVFDEHENIGPQHVSGTRRRAVPGKMGPQGIKGDRGFPGIKGQQGNPGIVDYNKVNYIIGEATNNIQRQMEELEQRMLAKINESLNKQISHENVTVNTNCEGIRKGDKCYMTVLHDDLDVNYEEAVEICRMKSARPGDISDLDLQQFLENQVRNVMTVTRTSRFLWTGMSYSPEDSVMNLYNGHRVSYNFKWNGGYPLTSRDDTQIGINVHGNPSEKGYGLFNEEPSMDAYGVVCES